MKLDRNLVIIDVETSGTNPEEASIIQLGAVIFDGKEGLTDESFSSYVFPYREGWSEESQQMHGLTKDFLGKRGRDIAVVLGLFEDWLCHYKNSGPSDYYVAQWSCGFDTDFLKDAYASCGTDYPFSYKSYDIASFVRLYLAAQNKLSKKRKNGAVRCARKLDLEVNKDKAHDGLYDAQLAGRMLEEVMKRCG